VPRQLYEFSRFIHNTVGQVGAPPSVELCDEFFKKQFPDKKDPITRLHYLLDLFLKKMVEVFKTLHISYYMRLDATFQPAFIKMCVDVLTYSNSTFATPQYLYTKQHLHLFIFDAHNVSRQEFDLLGAKG
jgi:hypothetical protein